MIKNYVDLKRNEKFERKIKIACDFHSAKYEFMQGRILNVDKVNVSFIEPHRFEIKLNGKKILVLYFDEDNIGVRVSASRRTDQKTRLCASRNDSFRRNGMYG